MSTNEYWHGFTVDVAQTSIAEPGALVLFLSGFLVLVLRKRYKNL